MKTMYELKEKLCAELDEIGQKEELSIGDLELAHKLTDTIKNINKIEMQAGGSSRRGDYSREGEYARGGSWEADMRGNYGRGHSYKRDSMGRYSRAEAQEHMRTRLEDMVRETDDERVKEALRRCMGALGE